MRLIYSALILVTLIACAKTTETDDSKHSAKALQFLDNALDKSGSLDRWNKLAKLSFVKKTRMFLPDSSIEMESLVRQTYANHPHFSGEIVYLEDSLQRRIVQNGKEVKYFELGKEVDDSLKLASAARNIRTQFYVIGLPYKLKDDGPLITDVIVDKLPELGNVNSLYVRQRVSQGNEKDENWWVYFDKSSHHMIGYLIEHDGRFSFIVNDSTTIVNGFPFPIERRSLAMDKSRGNKYLRADYIYSDINIEISD